jgi:predicted DNA-binding transcriptional regulator YafY
MNRTDRLLAIVLELQGHGWRRASDLAATFECSRRTIYRDLQALGETGVPLVSVPGRGFSLMEGYFLPPLTFTADEATMLLLGGDYMAQQFDAQYRAAAQSAGRKIAGVLPERLRAEVGELRESIAFPSAGISGRPAEAAKLQLLRRAIISRSAVRFRYSKRYGSADPSQPHDRTADPYAIINVGGTWLLAAYCHLRRAIRHFRLDRMDDLIVLERRFTRPAGYRVERRFPLEQESFTVRVHFDHAVVRWVRESPSFFTIAMDETSEGLLVTLRVRHADEVLPWLLGWGRHVHVLEPETLRRRLADEAHALLAHHENSS